MSSGDSTEQICDNNDIKIDGSTAVLGGGGPTGGLDHQHHNNENSTGQQQQQQQENLTMNEPKKVKLDSHNNNNVTNNNNNFTPDNLKNNNNNGNGGGNGLSRVVHIRNIPSDVTETEIVHLGIPFGRVSNVLVLKGKNQAFLELADESAALAMVTYFTNCVAQLRGRSVYVQFSTHKELKTNDTHSNANSAAQAALQAAQALVSGSGNSLTGLASSSTMDQSSSSASSIAGATQGGPNTVLRVIIEQMLYPVTLDVLFQIFSRVGKVLRVVTFTKNGFFQALVQYPDVVMAQAAKLSLDGQNIYNGCCTLRIEFSKLAALNVRYNNDKSRDYTNPSLPSGEPTNQNDPFNFQANANQQGYHHHQAFNRGGGGGDNAQAAALQLALSGGANRSSQAAAAGLAAALQHHPFGIIGGGGGGGGANNSHHHLLAAAAGLGLHHHAAAAAANLMGGSTGNSMLGLGLGGGSMNMNGSMGANGQMMGPGGISGGMSGPGCVLLVSNLPEDTVSPDGLFTLFGVYGDVQRVKILFNKKDSALIQMRDSPQAQLAMTYLDRLKLDQKLIRVTISKHTNVQMPKEGQPDAGLTKDFTNSPLHRFKKPDSKNYQNIYAPSSTLHISNIPANVNEDEITEAFKTKGFSPKGFKFFPKDRKMALVAMENIETAAAALIGLHNYKIRESANLRVSFSKSTI